MSTQSTKTARRPAKAPRRTTKKVTKSVKSARSSDKKSAKSARRGTGTSARTTALRAPSAASKPIGKAAAKAAAKDVAKATAKAALMDVAKAMAVKAASKMIRTSSPPVQPAVMVDAPLMAHKYHVGETVYFTSPTFGRAAATGSYTVVKLLPSESDDFQYRIKSDGEAFERVAKESQLDRA